MTGWPARIVIVGGGTAGWLSAMMLSDAAARKGAATRVTVIESTKIGVIGVGEGSTAVFRQMLRHFGLDEVEFLRETGATFKLGIRHKDWRRVGFTYEGPIDDPHLVAPGVRLDEYAVAAGRPVAEAHLFQHLIRKGRAPYALKDGRPVPAGPFQHAFHFDQSLVGRWLRKKAKGIDLIDDQVVGVEKGGEGIAAVLLESGRRVEGDFFLDCSGFRRVLISQMGGDWLSYADMLPNNRAMPFWLTLGEEEETDPVTTAWALSAGWMWGIPTQTHVGCGYVYSDAHLSRDQAHAELERALGRKIEPRDDIRINPGRMRETWIGNCCAVGLSSSFLEPLESTSIHGTVVQMIMMTEWLGDPAGRARYNAAVARQVDDFRDFVRLHYAVERRDTPYWRDVTAAHPPVVLDWLERAQRGVPVRADFPRFPPGLEQMNLAHVQEQLYVPVLDGLGLLSREAAQAAMAADPAGRDRARSVHQSLVAEYSRAAEQCVPQMRFLRGLG